MNYGLTWHLISMLKKSSLGSWWSPSPTRWPRLLWVIRRPGRFPTLTRWSSRRRLWELAIKSNSSSVWGEVVIAGSRRGEWKRIWCFHVLDGKIKNMLTWFHSASHISNLIVIKKVFRYSFKKKKAYTGLNNVNTWILSTDLSSRSGTAWS